MCRADKKISDSYNILVINPGSTSTKVALYSNDNLVDLQIFPVEKKSENSIWSDFDTRLAAVQYFLHDRRVQHLDAVAGRGGLLKPVRCGTYLVNETMLADARKGVQGQHAANLGCALAYTIAKKYACAAYVVDLVSVDEFAAPARYSGHPLIERRTLSHALSIRASAFKAASLLQKNIEDTHFIVAHMGGGISVAAVKSGRIVDVNDAAGAGPFSPERTGSLPLQQFVDLCFSGKYAKDDIKRMVMGQGGLKAYLGTDNVHHIESRIDSGENNAKEIFDAMIYQIAKEIGGMSCVLHGKVDAIIFTGGVAKSTRVVQELKNRVGFIAPVFTFTEELEMPALALGVLRVLKGIEVAHIYE
ncbi:butyrate kinase [candidate division KSB1 bacterium]|nr:butyrate kinase [candidate division KSB1 bacterium]RQW00459.1 MAG: butyrate kinase [candidate division KSB1 bacterium]